mmetsp:Transcript_5720/g.13916  ORF Transcript_5720/g.13916 Transcript_5720/m.13916 type:complete len:342 (-) Transcript_5720:2983-4008(-)
MARSSSTWLCIWASLSFMDWRSVSSTPAALWPSRSSWALWRDRCAACSSASRYSQRSFAAATCAVLCSRARAICFANALYLSSCASCRDESGTDGWYSGSELRFSPAGSPPPPSKESRSSCSARSSAPCCTLSSGARRAGETVSRAPAGRPARACGPLWDWRRVPVALAPVARDVPLLAAPRPGCADGLGGANAVRGDARGELGLDACGDPGLEATGDDGRDPRGVATRGEAGKLGTTYFWIQVLKSRNRKDPEGSPPMTLCIFSLESDLSPSASRTIGSSLRALVTSHLVTVWPLCVSTSRMICRACGAIGALRSKPYLLLYTVAIHSSNPKTSTDRVWS